MKTSLNEIHNSIWQQLIRAKNDRKHPFRFGTFGTVNENGANMRTVVIRKVIKEANELWLYTDFRTPKVREVEANSNISWHFYHQKQQIQIRLYGTAEIIHNEKVNKEIWQNLPEHGKSDYLTKKPPGTAFRSEKESENQKMNLENSENFCVIKTKIKKIDWLKLSREGHQRAGFQLIDNQWIGERLIP